ncbi:MAG: CinA family protein [Treponema sp.]|jgi:PncC family amidohydrolase|nr:CinA family protein [Treponema sp.]
MEECKIELKDCKTFADLKSHAEKTAEILVHELKKRSLTLALSESCTAGLVSSFIAGVPGASAVLWGSFVCYTPEAKASMLDINMAFISTYGAVSRETASSMALGALQKSGSNLAAAVTGLAGPDGDGSNVPVGTVWIAAAHKGGTLKINEHHFTDCREAVRIRSAIAVLEIILSILPG